MATLIEFFDVPPAADHAFLADWRAERGSATLYRALRDDSPMRFVSVATSSDDGLYEIVHDDGDVFGAGGVTMIEPADVSPETEEQFLQDWHRSRGAVAAARGYLGTRLHRATRPADFRFVAIARWSSPLMVARVMSVHPTLYQPTRGS